MPKKLKKCFSIYFGKLMYDHVKLQRGWPIEVRCDVKKI